MKNKEIIQAITAIFSGVDEHNWAKIENQMTSNVLLDYTTFIGGEPANLSPKQITESWAGFLPGFDKTNHQLSNFEITLNLDKAMATYTGKADHFIDNEVWTVEGTYESELKKINSNWLVSKLKFNFVSQSGNLDLPAKATQRMKA
jgi:SnoaL-like domain